MPKILVVEDDTDIQELLWNFLREAGYDVTVSGDGLETVALFQRERFDLILLDVMLPKLDGFGVLELIRQSSRIPVVMLTALGGEEEQIRGLDMQADDYIVKPFSMPVLVRKIAAVLRRGGGKEETAGGEDHAIVYGRLSLDPDSHTAEADGENIELTQKEFEILRELLTHQGRVFSREQLLEKIWGYDFYGDERVVDTHIKNLRKNPAIDFIQTVRGVGYRVEKQNKK